MDQFRSLEPLPRWFMGQSSAGERAQLIVHNRQQLFGCLRLSVFDSLQDAVNVAHGIISRNFEPRGKTTMLASHYRRRLDVQPSKRASES